MTESYCNDPRCPRVRKGESHPIHDLSKVEEERNEDLRRFLELGSELAGGSIGAAAGLAVAGPQGAIVGSILGTSIGFTLKQAGLDLLKRILSLRESKRAAAVLIHASNKIDSYRKMGHSLRGDDFFNNTITERSAADEIAEGVILAAQREHEEKKLTYFGNLLANIAFSSGISRAHGDALIKISKGLTYRQLCLLSIFGQNDKFTLRPTPYTDNLTLPIQLVSILHEILQLEKDALISSGNVVLALSDINPGKFKLEGEGQIIFKLMNLTELPTDDLAPVADALAK